MENSFLDSGKMNIEVMMETGDGIFFQKVPVICFRAGKGYGSFTEIRLPVLIKFSMKSIIHLQSVDGEGGIQYVVLAIANAGYQTPTEGGYQGKLDIRCSIRENQIETEWSFKYVVKWSQAESM